MALTADDILQVVRDPVLHSISFSVGPININAYEYDAVGDCIESGAIHVVPGTTDVSHYYPKKDTIETRAGNLTLEARTNLLHECTHAIADINQVKVTRMVDEAAAYLAQVTYYLRYRPNEPKPPMGRYADPMNTVMRLCMDLVEQYHLDSMSSYGAAIKYDDIMNLANAVHTVPDYNSIKVDEELDADGVSFSDDEEEAAKRIKLARYMKDIRLPGVLRSFNWWFL